MNREVKQFWCNGLRQGYYEQNKGKNLADNDGFDALGVLCDLYVKASRNTFGLGGAWKLNEILHCYTLDEQSDVLPLAVADWAGIPQTPLMDRFVVPIEFMGKDTNVAALCDQGLSFEIIADLIEERL